MAEAGTGGEDGAQGLGLVARVSAAAPGKKAFTQRRKGCVPHKGGPTDAKKISGIEFWIACFVFAVTPLGLLSGVFLSHDVMPKVILVLCGAAALLLLLPRWAGGIGRWFLWLAMAQVAVLVVSTLFSDQPLLSLVGTTWRRYGTVEQIAALVVACCVAARPERAQALWRAVSACAGVASVYGIAQYFGIDPFLEQRLYAIDYLGGIVRPPATMGHAIYYSAYLVPVILIAVWQATQETQWGWRAPHGAVVALGPVAILLSGSRGALLGLAAGGIVLLVYRRPSTKLIGAAVGALLVVAAFVAFAPMGESLRNRIRQWKDDPGSVRLAVWRDSPGLIAKAPLLGSGPETFAGAFRKVESAELARAYPDFINETPHNIFVDAACEEGLAGLSILVGLFVVGLRAKGSPGLRLMCQ